MVLKTGAKCVPGVRRMLKGVLVIWQVASGQLMAGRWIEKYSLQHIHVEHARKRPHETRRIHHDDMVSKTTFLWMVDLQIAQVAWFRGNARSHLCDS